MNHGSWLPASTQGRRNVARRTRNPAIDRAQSFRLRLFSLLVIGVLGSGCTTAITAENTDELFERYEVDTGPGKRQTILVGSFLGGSFADLAVLHLDNNGDRRLRIYAFDDGTWVEKLNGLLGAGVLFVDVANIGGRDRLITYERGRLNWFDPDTATERALVKSSTNYNSSGDLEGSPAQPGADIPQVDITRDLNHDGLDDLVVPDFDGFWISTQLSDGSFTDSTWLGPPEPFLDADVMGMEDEAGSYRDIGITAGTIPVYLSRIHEMDYNQDGRSDLVFWNEDHFDVYFQREEGRFDPVARPFTSDVPFDSEGAYSRVADFDDEGVVSLLFGLNEKTSRTVLHAIRDLNGDRIGDLVTLTLAGRTILRQRSQYEVHFGKPTPDGTLFARGVGTTLTPKGKAGGMQAFGYSSQIFEDFDGDGQIDVMFRDVRTGFGGMTRALVGNSVPIDLEFYRMQDSIYPDKPTTRCSIRRFAPFAGMGNVFLPPVLMGDVNGDGRKDLLIGQSPKELRVFVGVPGPSLFAEDPLKVAVALPSDERHTWLADLNMDGKQDLIVNLAPSVRAPTEPHRLLTLIAR